MRPLSTIAVEIENDAGWSLVSNTGAKTMLGHMKGMGLVTDPFHHDPDGYGVVSSFLSNSIGWKPLVPPKVCKKDPAYAPCIGASLPPWTDCRPEAAG